ncbi:MAG TPA: GRRM system radical SAM/SPASM domain protein [Deltaproteobacteria bacterium]|jgi:uncharacterized protein|nr:GRRM system radical SAM/SPASM domain protein [Deltaproteobacteria bacterium]
MNERFGPLDLLVIQPTPFCNLDCSYCYLPDRGNRRRISSQTLERIFAWVAESGLVRRPYTIVWHAGEPLVLPTVFYEDAFAAAARFTSSGHAVSHSFQTNGTLINDKWCALFQRPDVRVGVSVDGPAYLHDARRRTRSGGGTHARVMAGLAQLQRHCIPFHVITVLTREALDYPDELHAFYVDNGIERVGFNVEEIEGPNEGSSLSVDDAAPRYRDFMSRFFDLAMASDPPMRIREFDNMISAVMYAGEEGSLSAQEASPFAILSVDCEGSFSTFSPELLGLPSEVYGGFGLGNVASDSFAKAVASDRFQAMARDVGAGIAKCRRECSYFRFCGGGAPANKYFENGSFDSTETLFCRLHRKTLTEVVLSKMQGPRPRYVDAA